MLLKIRAMSILVAGFMINSVHACAQFDGIHTIYNQGFIANIYDYDLHSDGAPDSDTCTVTQVGPQPAGFVLDCIPGYAATFKYLKGQQAALITYTTPNGTYSGTASASPGQGNELDLFGISLGSDC